MSCTALNGASHQRTENIWWWASCLAAATLYTLLTCSSNTHFFLCSVSHPLPSILFKNAFLLFKNSQIKDRYVRIGRGTSEIENSRRGILKDHRTRYGNCLLIDECCNLGEKQIKRNAKTFFHYQAPLWFLRCYHKCFFPTLKMLCWWWIFSLNHSCKPCLYFRHPPHFSFSDMSQSATVWSRHSMKKAARTPGGKD